MSEIHRFSFTAVNGGYGAASFAPAELSAKWVELQVAPDYIRLFLNDWGAYRGRRAEWRGADAVAMGAAVCDCRCPAAVLADWLEEHPPAECDRGFDPAYWLRHCSV